jgi:uncharacterized membrane protein YfhO
MAGGRLLRIVPVEGDFLGCLVEPGLHRIEFRFNPRSFVRGRRVTATGVVLLAAGVVMMMRTRRSAAAESGNL